MMIKYIVNWFKNRKKNKELKKFNLKQIILKKYEILFDFYNNKNKFYCSKSKFNNVQKELKHFDYMYKVNKKLFLDNEKKEIENLFNFLKKFKNHEEFNKEYIIAVVSKLPKDFFLFKNINLDNNQIESIIKEDKINLVIAGAGSGKTTTILGKIKYLVEICNLDPQKILVLSYSNKSVDDFNERIKKYLDYDIKATTIHSFSNSISAQTSKKRNSVIDENNENKIFMECFYDCLNSTTFKKLWSNFIAYYWNDKVTEE